MRPTEDAFRALARSSPRMQPEEGTVYPEAYDVALDVQTGVVVEVSPVGP